MINEFEFPQSRELEPMPTYEGVDVEFSSGSAYGDHGEVLRERLDDLGGGSSSSCVLGDELTSTVDTDKKILRAGNIHCAGTHTSVGGEADPLTPAVGSYVLAEVTIAATVSSGVLTGAYTASGADLSVKTTVPDDHDWTAAANSGKAYATLGKWTDDGSGNPVWENYGCGDVTFVFCANTTDSGHARFYRG